MVRLAFYPRFFQAFRTHRVAIFASVIAILPLLFFAHKNQESVTGPLAPETGWKRILIYVGPVQNLKDDDELMWKSSSQIGQDTVINNIFPDSGYFVDLAANDWKSISNTHSLEVYSGWNGICIEANSKYLEGHKRRRSTYVSAVVGNNNEQVNFSHGNGALGGIVSEAMDNANADPNSTGVSQLYTVSIEDIFRISDVP